jgi:hypothetical protein
MEQITARSGPALNVGTVIAKIVVASDVYDSFDVDGKLGEKFR